MLIFKFSASNLRRKEVFLRS